MTWSRLVEKSSKRQRQNPTHRHSLNNNHSHSPSSLSRLCVKIDRLRQQAYQKGKFISIGICDPGGVIPINHWIWYDFDKREPVISRAYPSDHKIPEAIQRQLASKQSPASLSQGAGIRLSSPSLGGNTPEEQGFAYGGGMPDDFKHFLEMHPGMSIEEALHRFRDEQKAKQRRTGPKLH